jgi:hypothetical protein
VKILTTVNSLSQFFLPCKTILMLLSLLLLIFDGTGVWTRGFMLARQVLYHLSHTSCPFCSDYFGNRILIYSHASLDHNHPIYASHSSLDDRYTPLHLALAVEMGYLECFCEVSLEMWPSDLSLLHSRDHRCVQLLPSIGWDGSHDFFAWEILSKQFVHMS